MLRSCPQNVPSGRDPQAKSRQKDVRNLRRDGLESLGIAPTFHFTNDRPQYLSQSQQESCRGANIVLKDIAVLSCHVLDTSVSRRLMHQRTSDPLCRVTSEPSFYKCAVQLRRALPIRPCPISRFPVPRHWAEVSQWPMSNAIFRHRKDMKSFLTLPDVSIHRSELRISAHSSRR